MFRTRLLRSSTSSVRILSHPRLAWRPQSTILQRRTYMYRLVNHQRLLASFNTLGTVMRSPMFWAQITGIGILGACFYGYNLERVPISGRLRFNVISSHLEAQLGRAYFKRAMDRLADDILPTTSPEHCKTQRILEQLLMHSNLPSELWEVHIVNDAEAQAFVLPGGKVFVNTGMLGLCSRDDELAIVLGHEIMHNFMHHSSEGLSRTVPVIIVDALGSLVTGLNPDLVGLATDVAFRLPRSREQEYEADYHGLLLAAKSGYDASAALDLWVRWEQVEGEKHAAPEYLSTHPSRRKRTAQFHSWLSEARGKRLWYKDRVDDFENLLALQQHRCGEAGGSVL